MKKLLYVALLVLFASCEKESIEIGFTNEQKDKIHLAIADSLNAFSINYSVFIDSVFYYEYDSVKIKYQSIIFKDEQKFDSLKIDFNQYKKLMELQLMCLSEINRIDSIVKNGISQTKSHKYFGASVIECEFYRLMLNEILTTTNVSLNRIDKYYTDSQFSCVHNYSLNISLYKDNNKTEQVIDYSSRFVLNSDYKILWIENE